MSKTSPIRSATLTLCLSFALTSAACAQDVYVERVFVKAIQETDIPAEKAGVIRDLKVRQGAMLTKGQIVAELDDRLAKISVRNAEMELRIAEQKVDDNSELELAKKTKAKESQALQQRQIELKVSQREASNELKIQATKKASDVTLNELKRAQNAKAEFNGSVSQSEIDGLSLSHEKAKLEAERAIFDRQQQELVASAEAQTVSVQELTVDQAIVEVQQATVKAALERLGARLQAMQLETAKLNLEQHRIRSNIEGQVAEVYKSQGEWVKPGDGVLRVVRLTPLIVEGYVPLKAASDKLLGRTAVINLTGFGEALVPRKGKIVFVSPTIDSVNKEIVIHAEFDNEDLQIRPGMEGTMTIRLEMNEENLN